MGPCSDGASAVTCWNNCTSDYRALAQELATALDHLNWLHGAIRNTKLASEVIDALAHARAAGLEVP
jgi:hypothetical protein